MSLIYKLLTAAEWAAAQSAGHFEGSAVDQADGFIHFSASGQVQETARRYFANVADLLILAVETNGLGDGLKWEASRGGDLFPHLYGPLALQAVIWSRPVALDSAGVPLIDDLPS